MRQPETTPISDMGVLYMEALGKLRADGSERMTQQAAAALIMWSARHPREAGRIHEQAVGWGGRYPCIDYVAQELPIGNIHFSRVDMGYEIPLSLHLRTALGEPGKVEKNQCACVPLALGMEWMAQGRRRGITDKTRVTTLDAQLRSAEYQKAQEFMTRCTRPYSKITAKLFSLAHDVMPPNVDRNSHGFHLFFAGMELTLHKHAVRVFDLEWRGNHTAINAHQHGGPEQRIDLDTVINLIVWRGHMGFLLPSSDTQPTSWRDWQQQVDHVTVDEWGPWDSAMDGDKEESPTVPLYPCST